MPAVQARKKEAEKQSTGGQPSEPRVESRIGAPAALVAAAQAWKVRAASNGGAAGPFRRRNAGYFALGGAAARGVSCLAAARSRRQATGALFNFRIACIEPRQISTPARWSAAPAALPRARPTLARTANRSVTPAPVPDLPRPSRD